MKIIDAHIHFKKSIGFDQLALASGHVNTEAHLKDTFDSMGIMKAVVMGNGPIDKLEAYPSFLSYCVGFDSSAMANAKETIILSCLENHLRRPNCCGIKLYPGYNRQYITDKAYFPFYDLAAQYKKPVAIHTGATANDHSHLKYCHPLIIDELAADFPHTTFVICHYGNPWVLDAAAVLDKNKNVCADLSGILDGGLHDIDAYCRENSGYVEYLKTWIKYPIAFDRIMYGSDWPLINMSQYTDFISRLVPPSCLEDVFFNNANMIYSLGL
ncbi:MAG: amidohydrolase family protein [Clostridiaceae bacterium]|nr:amidohydrolase family protein [Clostridiaceae bacterium]